MEIVKQAKLFCGMPEESIRAFLDSASRHCYLEGHQIYSQGGPACDFFLVESGLIRISQISQEGGEFLVRFARPGDVFGYLSITGADSQQVTSAHAVRPSTVLSWNRATALAVLEGNPRASMNLFSIASRELVNLLHRIQVLKTEPVRQRVESALRELADAIGEETPEGTVIEYTAGQRQIADLAGTTIYTVSRELGELERRGIIRKRRGRIVVLRNVDAEVQGP